ncbi:Hypothetical_protein [Hexamita inflata]|uniref:Hypothetical_protein n=1 Tax=Hexamita inflata TaxID=28002 RepID=A0AA86N4T2_9EUKA|nr:Hypothetical protein HINF_LOCUS549 [Hexamita inflata]
MMLVLLNSSRGGFGAQLVRNLNFGAQEPKVPACACIRRAQHFGAQNLFWCAKPPLNSSLLSCFNCSFVNQYYDLQSRKTKLQQSLEKCSIQPKLKPIILNLLAGSRLSSFIILRSLHIMQIQLQEILLKLFRFTVV